MRLLPVTALVAVSGCAQLFGIDDTKGIQNTEATLQLSRTSIGTTVATNPLDVTSLSATFYTTDMTGALTATPGTQTAIDTWSADVTGNPMIELTLPDLPMPYEHLWALPSRTVRGQFIAYEHPNAQPPPSAGVEQLAVGLPTMYAGESLQVDVVGAWARHVLSGTELPATGATMISTMIPYASFIPISASPVTRIAASDAVLVLRYAANTLTGVYSTSFDQSDTMDMIAGTMSEVSLDKMLSAQIDPATFASRFQLVRPADSTLSMAWDITAAPGYTAGSTLGPLLRAGAPAATDMAISATYGNPFEARGWKAVLTFVAAETRVFSANGVNITLRAQLATVVDPTSVSVLDLPAPLAELISIDSHQLNMDGMMVSLDVTAPHTITAITESSPAASLYTLAVYDLVTVGTELQRKPVLDAISVDPTFTVPPDVLQTGHTYVVTVGTAVGWYPNIMSGDLDTVTMPFTASTVDSSVFQVMP